MFRFVSALSLALALTAIGSAESRADIPPPEVEMCSGKAVGDACDGGTCQKATCSRATPDGGVSYECVKCLPGETAKPASEKKNCGAAPDALLFGLSGLFGLAGARALRRKTA